MEVKKCLACDKKARLSETKYYFLFIIYFLEKILVAIIVHIILKFIIMLTKNVYVIRNYNGNKLEIRV